MTPKALLAHYNALITLVRYLLDDRTGGVFSATVEMLTKVIGCKGALSYRVENSELVLVSETGLPRKAKAWLARMPIDDEPWFIAQRVAATQKPEVDSQLADSRMGHSIRPALEAAGWKTLAGAPIRMGRKVFGVLVVAGGAPFDRQTLLLIETICGLLALSSERDRTIQRGREDKQREAKTAQLATMGLLASNVARDLATPLASIQLQLEQQEARLRDLRHKLVIALGDEDAPELDALEEAEVLTAEIGEGLRHTQGITSRLLAFSRETRPETIDLSVVMQSAIQLLREGIEARGIFLEVEGDDEQMLVDGREEALQMLVVQLVLHAADEIDAAKVRGAKILVRLLIEDKMCVISVDSSGRGAQRSNVQVFDAMMRDGGAQAAAGLQLARQTAVAHGGQLELGASDLGGQLVRIVLPESAMARAEAVAPEPAPNAEPRRRLTTGNRRIIVWIDEDANRVKSVSRMITTHETIIAGSIAEASEVLDSLDILPELILCEVALADGWGVDLHCEVEEELADKFVFVTGGVVGEDVAAYLKASGRPTLIKPVSVEEVRALLVSDERPAAAPAAAAAPRTPNPNPPTPTPGARPNAASLFGQGPVTPPVHMRRARRTQKRRDAATVQEVPRSPEEIEREEQLARQRLSPEELAAEELAAEELADDELADDEAAPTYTEESADATPIDDLGLGFDDILLDDEDIEL